MPDNIINIGHAENVYFNEKASDSQEKLRHLIDDAGRNRYILEAYFDDETLAEMPREYRIVSNYYIVLKTGDLFPCVLMVPHYTLSKGGSATMAFPHTLLQLPARQIRLLREIKAYFEAAVSENGERLAVAEETLLYSLGIQKAELVATKAQTEYMDGICTYYRGFLVKSMDELSLANVCDIEGIRGNHHISLHKIGDSRFVFDERDRKIMESEELKSAAILTDMKQVRYGFCLKVDFHLHPASGLFMKKITESLLPDRMLTCMREVRASLDDQLKCGYISDYAIDRDTATIILPECLDDPKTRIYEVVGRLTGRLTIYFGHLLNRGNDEDVRKQLCVRCMAVERNYTYGKSYPDSTAEIGEIEFPRFPDYLDNHPAGTSIVIERANEDLGLEHMMDRRKYAGDLVVYQKFIK